MRYQTACERFYVSTVLLTNFYVCSLTVSTIIVLMDSSFDESGSDDEQATTPQEGQFEVQRRTVDLSYIRDRLSRT